MKVFLEQNGGSDSTITPYFAHIEIATMTVDFNTSYMIPIKQRVNGKTTFAAEICGFQVEADSPDTTVSLVEKLVQELVNLARLPTYVFIARRSHKMYPVYTFRNEVFATTPGGPLFKHVELAKVREYLSDYMHTIGQLGAPGKSETLHVRGIHRKSLGLIRPIFYLKKRAEGNDSNEFWAPVFPSQDGQLIYTYAVNGRREADIDNGHEILRLRSQVAQALIADGRLKEDYDLRADRLLPEYWDKVVANLELLPSKLTFGNTTFDMYQEGKYVIAIEYRTKEDRYSFYIGKGVDDLRARAAKDLARRNLVTNEADVKIQGAV
jgi:hypothetical protein